MIPTTTTIGYFGLMKLHELPDPALCLVNDLLMCELITTIISILLLFPLMANSTLITTPYFLTITANHPPVLIKDLAFLQRHLLLLLLFFIILQRINQAITILLLLPHLLLLTIILPPDSLHHLITILNHAIMLIVPLVVIMMVG